MGFAIGLIIFVVILWVIIKIAIDKDLDSVPSTIRNNNVSLPSVSSNNSSNQISSNKNFYNSEAAKYCSSKIVEGILDYISGAQTKPELERIKYFYGFHVTGHCVKLCDDSHSYRIPDWKYNFDVHRYPPLNEHEDREALAMAICNRVNAELKIKLPEAKLTYSTERDDYVLDPSFTVLINYTVPNPNYIELKSW